MSLLRRRLMCQKKGSDFDGYEFVYDASKGDILNDGSNWTWVRGNYNAAYEENTERGFHIACYHGYGSPRIIQSTHTDDKNSSIELELSFRNTNATITLRDDYYAVQVSFSRWGGRKLLLFPTNADGGGTALVSLSVPSGQLEIDTFYRIKLVKEWISEEDYPHYQIYFNDVLINEGDCQATSGLKTGIKSNNAINNQGAGYWTANANSDIYIKKLVYRAWE